MKPEPLKYRFRFKKPSRKCEDRSTKRYFKDYDDYPLYEGTGKRKSGSAFVDYSVFNKLIRKYVGRNIDELWSVISEVDCRTSYGRMLRKAITDLINSDYNNWRSWCIFYLDFSGIIREEKEKIEDKPVTEISIDDKHKLVKIDDDWYFVEYAKINYELIMSGTDRQKWMHISTKKMIDFVDAVSGKDSKIYGINASSTIPKTSYAVYKKRIVWLDAERWTII